MRFTIIAVHYKRKIIINIYRPDHLVHQTQHSNRYTILVANTFKRIVRNFNALAAIWICAFAQSIISLYIMCRIKIYTKIDDLPLVHVCHGFYIYDHHG